MIRQNRINLILNPTFHAINYELIFTINVVRSIHKVLSCVWKP